MHQMKIPAVRRSPASRNASTRLVEIVSLLVLLGWYWAGSTEQMLAYLIVLAAGLLPSVLWARMGAPGIPVFPVVASAYIPYFAFPIATRLESAQSYLSSEIMRAALTVALFLVTATVAWRLVASKARPGNHHARDQFRQSDVILFIFVGLAIGI